MRKIGENGKVVGAGAAGEEGFPAQSAETALSAGSRSLHEENQSAGEEKAVAGMERVDDNGERREVTPSELAHFDQLEAHYQMLLQEILVLRGDIKQAAMDSDDQRLGNLTRQMDELAHREWPEAAPGTVNFIMFLAYLLEQARTWTERVHASTDAAIRILAAVARPGHPVFQAPTFDQESLDRQMEAVADALMEAEGASPNVFTTDTGVKLHNVHPEGTCEGTFCVVHSPAPGPWETWDTHWREDWGLMVRVCPHDVHHVAIEEKLRMPLIGLIDHEHPAGCACACDFSRLDTVTDDEGKIVGFRAKK